MRILEFVKRIVPFVLTLAIGISVATVFYAFTSVNSYDSKVNLKSEKNYEKRVYKTKKKKKKCRYKRNYRSDY